MSYKRPAFDEALEDFRAFLKGGGRSDRLLWITRDRITAHRLSIWIFRPSEMTSDLKYRQFYEALRRTNTSIRFDSICETSDGSVVYVEDYGGDGEHLNYGYPTSERRVTIISSRLYWWFICAYCRLRGTSPFISVIPDLKKLNQQPESKHEHFPLPYSHPGRPIKRWARRLPLLATQRDDVLFFAEKNKAYHPMLRLYDQICEATDSMLYGNAVMGGGLVLAAREDVAFNESVILIYFDPENRTFSLSYRHSEVHPDQTEKCSEEDVFERLRLFLAYKFGIYVKKQSPRHDP